MKPNLLLPTLLLISGLWPLQAFSQLLYPDPHPFEVLNKAGNPIKYPCGGGSYTPQASSMDLNGDGKKDLVFFEPLDGKIHPYLSEGFGLYNYAPEYEGFFPPLFRFALLVDYNNDGREDIFTYSSIASGIALYENVGTGPFPEFKRVTQLLEYRDVGYDLNVYVSPSDIPVIDDVDGDGDIDILAFDVTQTAVNYYKNFAMDSLGHTDTLKLHISDRCWGKFFESLDGNNVELNKDCGRIEKEVPKGGVLNRPNPQPQGGFNKTGSAHGASSMLLLDYDGDGDKDLLLGDVQYPEMLILENGRIQNGQTVTTVDSIIAYYDEYPRQGTPISIPYFPAAFKADVNNDGVLDLIATPQNLDSSKSQKQVFYYRNEGTDLVPDFEFGADDLLQAEMIEEGSTAAPAFTDYDNDGLMDLLLAVQRSTTGERGERLLLYHNEGTAGAAQYRLVQEDLLGLNSGTTYRHSVASADLNGDGNDDILIGSADGTIAAYCWARLNNGTPSYTETPGWTGSIDVGGNSIPCVYDLDGDGLTDLLVGNAAGAITYFRNTGSNTQPVFTEINNRFGKVRTNAFYYVYIYDTSTGKVIDSIRNMEPIGFAAPTIGDIDGNGQFDLICGSLYGDLFYFPDIEGRLNDSFEQELQFIGNPLTQKIEQRKFGFNSIPTAYDVDDDGKDDLIIGNFKGGLYACTSQNSTVGVGQKSVSENAALIYPNPADGQLWVAIQRAYNHPLTISIYNNTGQLIQSHRLQGQQSAIDLNGLAPALYHYRIQDSQKNNVAIGQFMKR